MSEKHVLKFCKLLIGITFNILKIGFKTMDNEMITVKNQLRFLQNNLLEMLQMIKYKDISQKFNFSEKQATTIRNNKDYNNIIALIKILLNPQSLLDENLIIWFEKLQPDYNIKSIPKKIQEDIAIFYEEIDFPDEEQELKTFE